MMIPNYRTAPSFDEVPLGDCPLLRTYRRPYPCHTTAAASQGDQKRFPLCAPHCELIFTYKPICVLAV